MTDHLQTILLQQVSESVSVVINQRSLRHDDANIDKVCHYFRVPLCPSLLKLWRKNVKPNIDFHLVHLNCIQLFEGSTERNQNQTANTSFSLFPLWAVTLLYKVCKMSILISRNIKWSKNTCLRYVHGFFTFFHVRSVIYKRRDDETMIAILNSTKNGDEI